MTDHLETAFPKVVLAKWQMRLGAARGILLVAAAVTCVFVLLSDLTFWQGIVGFALILAATLFLPRTVEARVPAAAAADMQRQMRQQAAIQFADALPDPCFLLDRRAVVMHRNPPAANQFPSTPAGNPIAFSIRHPALLSAIDRVRLSGVPQNVELHQTIPNETWFQIFVSPLDMNGDGGQAANWIVVTMHNLTEQKRVEAMRADFVANASHELRTPLTSLIGFVDTLQGPAARDPEARERFLGIMRAQGERMSKLIDDLLSLSRIELRQHVRPTTNVNLSLILGQVAEELQTQAKEAGVEVKVTVPEEPVNVLGQQDELYEVFENLIDNAIKYGADGNSVEVALAPSSRPGFTYMVHITDHGAGIAQEHVPRLTERFYRVDAESSRRKKGTGLGLAIVKHILSRHGAQMSIRSKLGEGTTVEILFAR